MPYPHSLLAITGPPDTWQVSGHASTSVFYVPHVDAWLKMAPSGLRAEVDALQYLSDKAPVPQVRFFLEEDGMQYLLTTALPGKPLCDKDVLADPAKMIHILSTALREFHGLDRRSCPLNQRLDVKLRTWSFSPEEYDWLTQHRPPEDLVVTHGDACLPNFLCDGARYTGCLDVADAGVADRWQDVSLSLWSLQYNLGTPVWGLPFLEAYGIAPDERKIEYYLRLNRMHNLDVL